MKNYYDEGRLAAREGGNPVADNRYQPDSIAYRQWRKGFYSREDEEASREVTTKEAEEILKAAEYELVCRKVYPAGEQHGVLWRKKVNTILSSANQFGKTDASMYHTFRLKHIDYFGRTIFKPFKKMRIEPRRKTISYDIETLADQSDIFAGKVLAVLEAWQCEMEDTLWQYPSFKKVFFCGGTLTTLSSSLLPKPAAPPKPVWGQLMSYGTEVRVWSFGLGPAKRLATVTLCQSTTYGDLYTVRHGRNTVGPLLASTARAELEAIGALPDADWPFTPKKKVEPEPPPSPTLEWRYWDDEPEEWRVFSATGLKGKEVAIVKQLTPTTYRATTTTGWTCSGSDKRTVIRYLLNHGALPTGPWPFDPKPKPEPKPEPKTPKLEWQCLTPRGNAWALKGHYLGEVLVKTSGTEGAYIVAYPDGTLSSAPSTRCYATAAITRLNLTALGFPFDGPWPFK